MFASGQKWNLFKPVFRNIFNETSILSELPFYAELNGPCPISVYSSIHKL